MIMKFQVQLELGSKKSFRIMYLCYYVQVYNCILYYYVLINIFYNRLLFDMLMCKQCRYLRYFGTGKQTVRKR